MLIYGKNVAKEKINSKEKINKIYFKDFSFLQCCVRVLRRIDIKYSFSILYNLSVQI